MQISPTRVGDSLPPNIVDAIRQAVIDAVRENGSASNDSIFTIPQFTQRNPAFPPGSIRHTIFHEKPEMIRAGVLIQHGRRLLIDEPRFFEWLRDKSRRAA
jgi:hypothetical protein